MKYDDIQNRVEELGKKQPWNHSIEIRKGVFTRNPNQTSQGKNLIKWQRMEGFLRSFSCKNKRILDIGANDGFFSLKFAELGAQVVALEADPQRIEKARFIFSIMDVSQEIKLINANIYNYDLGSLGYFDLVLCMGFLHRVPDPFTVFTLLTPLSDSFLLEFKALPEYAYDRPYLMYDGRRSDPDNPYSTCYFVPSVKAVIEMIRALGVTYYGIIGDPRSRRVMMGASKKNLPALREFRQLDRVNILYLLTKYTKRYGSDVLKTLRGDFGAKHSK